MFGWATHARRARHRHSPAPDPLIDAQFPPYDQVIPRDHKKIITVDRMRLIDALRRAQLMSSETARGGLRKLGVTARSWHAAAVCDRELALATSQITVAECGGDPDARDHACGVVGGRLLDDRDRGALWKRRPAQ